MSEGQRLRFRDIPSFGFNDRQSLSSFREAGFSSSLRRARSKRCPAAGTKPSNKFRPRGFRQERGRHLQW